MIINIERYVPLDEEGYLLNDLCFEHIPENLKEMLNAVKKGILNYCNSETIHSIYVRGSVARGQFYAPFSDIDLIGIFHRTVSIRQLKKELNKIIKEIYPENLKIDFYDVNYQRILLPTQFSIKVNSICIHGTDISYQIQRFKPDKGICFLQKSFEQDVKMAKSDLRPLLESPSTSLHQQQIHKIYGWIAKRILRVGLEVTLSTFGQYSRDLYSCYHTFAKLFPAYADQMFLIFQLYIERCEDIDTLLRAIEAVDDFLIGEINGSHHYSDSST